MRYHQYARVKEARYSEIASLPRTPKEAKNSIIDLVIAYRSRNIAKIPMKEILGILHNGGFDANVNWVMDTLKGQDGVNRITPQGVYLQQETPNDIGVTSMDQQAKSEEKVGKMAAKAAKKGIK